MIKGIGADIVEKHLCFFYNIDANFIIREKFGEDFLEDVSKGDRKAMENTFGVGIILTEQGAAARRHCGYRDSDVLSEDDWEIVTPADILTIKNAIYAAVSLGLDREVPSLEPTDLTLLEFEKKTGSD